MTTSARRIVAWAIALLALSAALAVVARRYARSHLSAPLAAAVAEVVRGLEGARMPDEADKARSACDHPRDACACLVSVAREGLDANLGAATLDLLVKAEERCKDRTPLPGMKAEALARVQRIEEARHQADVAFRTASNDGYANLALGLAAFSKLSLKEAEAPTRKALEAGRGAEAQRLLGRIELARGNYELSREHFLRVLDERPADTEAAFSAAMCSANLKRYNEAREAFIRVLRIDPKHVEARLHLALLALQIGATMEARHHAEELEKIAPGDPRLSELEAALAQAPATPPPAGP